jgi:hypothetical protein
MLTTRSNVFVLQILKIGGVSELEPEVHQASRLRALVARFHEITRDVGIEPSAPSFGQSGCSVAAAQVEHLHARRDAETAHQHLTAFRMLAATRYVWNPRFL